jgi:glycerophosphoryl diester phosphodiesterase
MLAFQEGLAAGAQALEMDIRVTRDAVPVVIHDPTLVRTAGQPGLVNTLSRDDLQTVDIGQGQRIPGLTDVLEQLPPVPLILDIKEEAASNPTIDVLRHFGASGRVLVGSFDPAPLQPFRRVGIATVASRIETAVFWGASRVAWRWLPISYAAFSIPLESSGVKVVNPRFLRLADRLAKPVHVWTIDDRTVAGELLSAGVSGIITNFPEEMRGLVA